MAKEGNVSSGEKGITKGPCGDCGTTDGSFTPVRRFSSRGKRMLVRLCEKCLPRP